MKKSDWIWERLGIKYPIVQGGMAWISDYTLANAVCSAGALGVLTSVVKEEEVLRDEISMMHSTNRAYGVNLMMQGSTIHETALLLADKKVPVIITGGGNAAQYFDLWHRAGSLIIPVVGNLGFALLMEQAGADALIVEGMESGGHIGSSTTLSLLPQVIEQVHIPVIAAGGMYNKESKQAMEILGASGVQVGTRFLIATECCVHKNYKQKIIQANDHGTVVIEQERGQAIRALRSSFTNRYQAELLSNPHLTNLQKKLMIHGRYQLAVEQGDEEQGCFLAGQIAGRIKREQTVEEIVNEFI